MLSVLSDGWSWLWKATGSLIWCGGVSRRKRLKVILPLRGVLSAHTAALRSRIKTIISPFHRISLIGVVVYLFRIRAIRLLDELNQTKIYPYDEPWCRHNGGGPVAIHVFMPASG